MKIKTYNCLTVFSNKEWMFHICISCFMANVMDVWVSFNFLYRRKYHKLDIEELTITVTLEKARIYVFLITLK